MVGTFYCDNNIFFWDLCLRIVLAVIVGFFIGLERELSHHPAGIKTHVLVCLGSAITSLIATEMAYQSLIIPASLDLSRIAAGVVSGMGFIGAGAIIKSRDGTMVSGITTAAMLWVSSCLGLAIGMGYYRMSILAFIAMYVATFALKNLERKVLLRRRLKKIEISFTEKSSVIPTIDSYFSTKKIKVLSMEYLTDQEDPIRSGQIIYRCRYVLHMPREVLLVGIIGDLAMLENILDIKEVFSGNANRPEL